jgi:hypothetical protein
VPAPPDVVFGIDVNRDGVLSSSEDLNGNRVLDSGEDRDRDLVLDANEDLNLNNVFETTSGFWFLDRDGDRRFDPSEDFNFNDVLDPLEDVNDEEPESPGIQTARSCSAWPRTRRSPARGRCRSATTSASITRATTRTVTAWSPARRSPPASSCWT